MLTCLNYYSSLTSLKMFSVCSVVLLVSYIFLMT